MSDAGHGPHLEPDRRLPKAGNSSIVGLDSSGCRPTAAQAYAARQAGVRMWSGYLASRSGVGVTGWSKANFDNARLCGSTPIGFCSGWDDPAAIRQLAAAWNVRACLDVEDGIRGNGPWVQGWLDTSGAGLYGGHGVHAGRHAAFYVLGAYPASGDPYGASWDSSLRPHGPCGWQWAGTHTEFGCAVDRGDYDAWFAGSAPSPTPKEALMLVRNTDDGKVYIVGESGARHLTPAEFALWQQAGLQVVSTTTPTAHQLPFSGARPYPRDATTGAIFMVGGEGKRRLSGPEWQFVLDEGSGYSVDVAPAILAQIPDAA